MYDEDLPDTKTEEITFYKKGKMESLTVHAYCCKIFPKTLFIKMNNKTNYLIQG